jgi:FtsH-binding integral membrane protein
MELTQRQTYDAGLRSYMLSIYNMMILGMLLSAATAWATDAFGLTETLKQGGLLFWVVALSPLLIVMVMSFGLEKLSLATLQILFWVFAAIEGVGLALIISRYTAGSVLMAFLSTSVGFAGLSLFGYTTKRNLGAMGNFLVFALFGLIALMLLNIFIASSGLSLVIGIAGILIFAGLTAWDTQTLKEAYSPYLDATARGRIVTMGALNLYLDFLNMFLFILRIFGGKSND